jgi:tRNA pseudouridine65 synthase
MVTELPVLLSAEQWVVVNKPSGLAVHQGWAREPSTVVQVVRTQLGEGWSPVHRLDRATSGALLLARDAETVRRLQAQFERLEVIKNYLALVRGITPECGLIDHAIAKSKAHQKRDARTAFRRVGTFERYSLVLARPFTGRLHQIRRHLKFISHPLIGDTKYGKGEHNRLFRERFALMRLALHATHLEFTDPYSGSPITCRAPLPTDLTVVDAMGLRPEVERLLSAGAWHVEPELLPLFA